MKNGHYIGLHTKIRFWLPRDRPYTELEAMVSHTLDINDGSSYSVSGYSKLWQWSRNKVRKFMDNIHSQEGHHKDTHRTVHGQGIVIKINNLHEGKDTGRTQEGHLEDTTINNKNKNNKDIGSNPPLKESVKGEGGGEKKVANGEVKEIVDYLNEVAGTSYRSTKEIVDYLNEVAGTSYRATTDKTKQLIQARMNEGFKVTDFEKVIDVKVASWKGDGNMSKYLRLETLFGNKFEGYLNEKPSIKPSQELNMVDILTEAYENN